MLGIFQSLLGNEFYESVFSTESDLLRVGQWSLFKLIIAFHIESISHVKSISPLRCSCIKIPLQVLENHRISMRTCFSRN